MWLKGYNKYFDKIREVPSEKSNYYGQLTPYGHKDLDQHWLR